MLVLASHQSAEQQCMLGNDADGKPVTESQLEEAGLQPTRAVTRRPLLDGRCDVPPCRSTSTLRNEHIQLSFTAGASQQQTDFTSCLVMLKQNQNPEQEQQNL